LDEVEDSEPGMLNRMKWQEIAKRTLLVFVLVSIGFALGKEVTLRRQGSVSGPATADGGANKVVVYYLHTTYRCVTCNAIERLARSLVEREFGEAMKAGHIEWREADFQKDEALARRYAIVSSCVVVADVRNGKEVGFQRLDEVWTRHEDPADFNEYVGAAIRRYLNASRP
jgi:hypothetical protein